ncbi:MAG: hypothetical protein IJ593_09170 [Lachnospiraceae bacterium]|nr:hypothetical protein [Lachnospiraceae bacterium]
MNVHMKDGTLVDASKVRGANEFVYVRPKNKTKSVKFDGTAIDKVTGNLKIKIPYEYLIKTNEVEMDNTTISFNANDRRYYASTAHYYIIDY